jgi:hypothetical protein
VLLQLTGDVALARGDLYGAADSAAGCRDALARDGYRDQSHLPLARLEAELHLAQDRARDALAVAQQALDRYDLQSSPRYAWPLLVASAQACTAALESATAAAGHGRAGPPPARCANGSDRWPGAPASGCPPGRPASSTRGPSA